MTLEAVLAALKLAGAAAPAFKSLFNTVKGTFSEKDQETLQAAYDEEIAASDDVQEDFEEARKGN